ncbi:MAG: oxygen-independent coproporphyrinogen III oxidase-like protein [Bacteriovorax sp.]|nr:oxygen-independent coproporphyrinogen III oxidase-like protein [Rhizobacter sp.]
MTDLKIPIQAVEAAGQAAEPVAERLARYMRTGTLSLAALPPLSLYVHLPWCLKKCPYCDFNSHELTTMPRSATTPIDPPRGREPDWERPDAGPARAELPIARYLDALCADLEAALPFIWGRRVHTIFIGGGTPSLFPPEAIDRLIADIRARLPLEPGCEITLEANPGTFERDRFRGYRAAGVTRLSIGVQSFDDAKLAALGRVHDAAQACAAIEEARAAFDTFNLDLMYALPGQTLAEFASDLDQALAFEPPHLSIYQLTIEANTVFAKYPPSGANALPDEDVSFDMLDLITARAAASGLERYEVSAFARPGHRCAHNLNYWQFGDYLGIGAGAHSKLSFPHRVVRQMRSREPGNYMAQALAGRAVAQDEEVPRAQLPFEFMLNATRLKEGFELARFSERTGLSLAAIQQPLATAEARGLIARDFTHLRPTPRGFDLLSDLQGLFLP